MSSGGRGDVILRAVALVNLFLRIHVLPLPLRLGLRSALRRSSSRLLLRSCLGGVRSRPTLVGNRRRGSVAGGLAVTRVGQVPLRVLVTARAVNLLFVLVNALERVVVLRCPSISHIQVPRGIVRTSSCSFCFRLSSPVRICLPCSAFSGLCVSLPAICSFKPWILSPAVCGNYLQYTEHYYTKTIGLTARFCWPYSGPRPTAPA